MNIAAIVYGYSSIKPDDKTLASLVGFDVCYCPCLNKLDICSEQFKSAEYVFFVKSGDELCKNAKKIVLKAIEKSNADIIYSDEAMVSKNGVERLNYYKPDYSPDMLLSLNYFRNLFCVKSSLLRVTKVAHDFSAQNLFYDIILGLLSNKIKIFHIDEVLYINHSEKNNITQDDFYENFNQEHGAQSLQKYCDKNNIEAEVLSGKYHATYRIKYKLIGEPLVSIIIPFKDQPELLKSCISSILKNTSYQNYEIIGVDNHSTENEILVLKQQFEQNDHRIKFINHNVPYNFSGVNNYAIKNYANGQYLILLNNDTEVISENWIEAMLEHAQRDEVGVVGAKLLYSDGTIQHAGGVTQCYMRHVFRCLAENDAGYFYFPQIQRNYSALTFACVMFKRSIYTKVDGLKEDLPIAYNDVDFCLRTIDAGFLNIYTPYAVLFHHESKSRGKNNTLKKRLAALRERRVAYQRSKKYFDRDRYYNKHLTFGHNVFIEKHQESLLDKFFCLIKKTIFCIPFKL